MPEVSSLLSSGKFTREKEGFPLPCLEGVVLQGEGAELAAGATLSSRQGQHQGSNRHPWHREGLGRGTRKNGGMMLLLGCWPDPCPVSSGRTQKTGTDPNQRRRENLLGGLAAEQPLCQQGTPWVMLPASPGLHTHSEKGPKPAALWRANKSGATKKAPQEPPTATPGSPGAVRAGTWCGLRRRCCCCCCWTPSRSCSGEDCSRCGTPGSSSSPAGSRC